VTPTHAFPGTGELKNENIFVFDGGPMAKLVRNGYFFALSHFTPCFCDWVLEIPG